MNVAIAAATNADLPAVLDLLQRTKLPRAEIERHVPTILVAREGERIVGCAAIEPYGAAALLRSVAVEPSSRGLGLGQQLTRAALDLARARGVKSVYLLTETAAEFFPRFGFRTVARKEVDPGVQRSVEFTGACPDSAIAMRVDLPG
jgi:amino-acid N-acetyltransferase